MESAYERLFPCVEGQNVRPLWGILRSPPLLRNHGSSSERAAPRHLPYITCHCSPLGTCWSSTAGLLGQKSIHCRAVRVHSSSAHMYDRRVTPHVSLQSSWK